MPVRRTRSARDRQSEKPVSPGRGISTLTCRPTLGKQAAVLSEANTIREGGRAPGSGTLESDIHDVHDSLAALFVKTRHRKSHYTQYSLNFQQYVRFFNVVIRLRVEL